MAYSIDGAEPELWWPDDPFPAVLADRPLWAHNAAFDSLVWRELGEKQHAFPPVERWHCTMALCAVHNWPLSLDGAAKALGLEHTKDAATGRKLIKRLLKDGKLNEEDLANFGEYCRQDVRATYCVAEQLDFVLPEKEQLIYDLDAEINQRGVAVNLPLLEAVEYYVGKIKELLNKRLVELTDGKVESPTKLKDMKEWLASRGTKTASLSAEIIESLLTTILPDDVREVLTIRKGGALSSVAKAAALKERVSADGRVRGMFQYAGARQTLRWAGRGVQPQNMPRGKLPANKLKAIIAKEVEPSLEVLEDLKFGMRHLFMAGARKQLLIADYSAIELRVLLTLMEDHTHLQMLREGRDLYSEFGTKVLGREVSKKTELDRMAAKTAVLGCGYGMGIEKFVATLHKYSKGAIGPQQAEEFHAGFHKEFAVGELWNKMISAAARAIASGEFQLVWQGGGSPLGFFLSGSDLHLIVPTGGTIIYHSPTLSANGREFEFSIGDMNRKAYGGALVENACQRIARDIMAEGMLAIGKSKRSAAFGTNEIVLHAHDEIVVEVEDLTQTKDNDHLILLDSIQGFMTHPHPTFPGCPLEVETGMSAIYTKI